MGRIVAPVVGALRSGAARIVRRRRILGPQAAMGFDLDEVREILPRST
jgi:hypothetical protein